MESVSGNRRPEVIDKYVTSYDKLYLCDLFWDTILLEAKKSRIPVYAMTSTKTSKRL
jgi:hypothetical protein